MLCEYTPHKSIENIFVEMNESNNASFYVPITKPLVTSY